MAVACGSEERKSCVENIIYGNYLSDVEREESGMLLWEIIKRRIFGEQGEFNVASWVSPPHHFQDIPIMNIIRSWPELAFFFFVPTLMFA